MQGATNRPTGTLLVFRHIRSRPLSLSLSQINELSSVSRQTFKIFEEYNFLSFSDYLQSCLQKENKTNIIHDDDWHNMDVYIMPRYLIYTSNNVIICTTQLQPTHRF